MKIKQSLIVTIFAYILTQYLKKTLFDQNYWEIMTIISLANGLMEAGLERRMEQ